MRMEKIWLIGSLAVTVPLLLVCAVAWWRTSRRVRVLESQAFDWLTRDKTTQRFEQAVASLTTQMDDLAAGQEFLQRIIASRAERTALPAAEPPRMITPH